VNAKVKTFQDILAWKKAHQLVIYVYKITDHYPVTEEFALKSHTRKTAFSIPSNIAEGFKRKSKTDSIRFYNIAEGSLEELKYQLLLGNDLAYLSKEEFEEFRHLAEEVGRLICGWMKSQENFK